MSTVKRRFPDILWQVSDREQRVEPEGDIVGKPISGDVDSPSWAYRQMARRWDLPVHLMGGTLAMRDAGTKWLPQEPAESNEAYRNRLNRTELYGAYKRTVQALSGYPFLRPAVVNNLHEELQYLKTETVDNGERDVNAFGQDVLKDLLVFGKAHILVDYPAIQRGLTLAEEKLLDIRPYLVQVSPMNVIGWKGQMIGAVEHLQNVRIAEEVFEDVPDSFEEVKRNQVRVIYPDRFEVWKEQTRDESKASGQRGYVLSQTLPNDLGYIPLVTIYMNRTGLMQSEPPLEDLAWLNLKHYRSQSDQDHILHTARVPILFGAGFQDGELENAEIGPNRAISVSDPQAELKYVEHSGAAIQAGETSIQNLENRMAVMGADFLTTKSVARQTASARMIDQTETLSVLESGVRNLEAGLEQAFRIAGDWMDLPDEQLNRINIEIGENLDLTHDSKDKEVLVKMRDMGILTTEQLIDELKRRGTLADYFEADPSAQRQPSQTNPEETSGTN